MPIPAPAVAVYTLGGTIASVHGEGADGATPALSPEQLLGAVPDVAEIAAVTTHPWRQVSSSALTLEDLVALAAATRAGVAQGAAGVVVTTGTDTLDEAAFALDLLWPGPEPLVVTGAMRSADRPGADGPANLRAALRVAADPAARELGCLVVLNDEIHAARHVQKTHTVRPSAFTSPASGPLGCVHENRVTLFSHPVGRPRFPDVTGTELPPVALLRCGLGDDGRLVDVIDTLGYRGLVVDSAGGGAVPPSWAEPLTRLAKTVPVLYTSRAGSGPVLEDTYSGPGCERDLIARGVIPAGHLTGLQARILLTLLLAGRPGDQALRGAIDQPYTL